MITFNGLNFKQNTILEGVHATIHFDNGYGALVIRHAFSYGVDDGLYEVVVINNVGIEIYVKLKYSLACLTRRQVENILLTLIKKEKIDVIS